MKKTRTLGVICISAALAATPLVAETTPTGCFAREYSQAHLASHPEQVVEAMWLQILDGSGDSRYPTFWIAVVMAHQGHALRNGLGGTFLEERGSCEAARECAVFCDGGGFDITRVEPSFIEITTPYMRVAKGDACGDGLHAYSSLAERPEQPTTYRLFRTNDWDCEQN